MDDCTIPLNHFDAGDAARDELGIVPVRHGIAPRSIVAMAAIGHGRAAQVRLVECRLADGRQLVAVEKVFRPALLTRLIYRLGFQAPFGYQTNQDAIVASFYRRRVAGAIIEAMEPGTRVAEPLYVRWDADAHAFVLGSEFIDGRGIMPQPLDSHMIRRRVSRWFGRAAVCPDRPREEVRDLLGVMTRLETLFLDCGLTGSGWQVCTRALVSTANLLHTPGGYVAVDLESGIPAVLVPKYLFAGLRLGALPPFDDVDPSRLRAWIGEHRDELITTLGAARIEQLQQDAELLIEHTRNWKDSEFALGRTKWRIFGVRFRERFKAACLDRWRRRDIIDESTDATIRPGRRIFSRKTFLLGFVPGAAGRFLQRLCANAPFRAQVGRFFRDADYRRDKLQAVAEKYTRRWRGRVAPSAEPARFNLAFLRDAALAQITPAALHRWLVDSVQRRNVLVRMLLICVSGRFQSEYGRHVIRSCIREWERAQRLAPREVAELNRQLDSSDMDEYVRCFGIHLGMKLLLPLLAPLKLGGMAAFLASGNLWFLFLLFLMPVCRTTVTIWRMIASQRPPADYIDALLVGMLPVVGTLAYPVQMYSKYRALSAFLLRHNAARLGRWLPIYGGKDSRIELWAIKSVNLIAECLEIGLASTAPLRRRLSRPAESDASAPQTLQFSLGRWHRLVDEQLQIITGNAAAESAPLPASASNGRRNAQAA